MGHLSSATQQTASASEELSATAEELSAQAMQLQELMSFFRLAEDEAATASRPRGRSAPAAAAATPLSFGKPAARAAARPAQARTQGAKAAGDIDESSFTHF
jgi:transcription initiation factor TFIID subunit TAF12